jgi:hypothetical protein
MIFSIATVASAASNVQASCELFKAEARMPQPVTSVTGCLQHYRTLHILPRRHTLET